MQKAEVSMVPKKCATPMTDVDHAMTNNITAINLKKR